MPRRAVLLFCRMLERRPAGLDGSSALPDDFDGIIAGNPANDWTRFYAGGHLWYSLAMLEDEESWILR